MTIEPRHEHHPLPSGVDLHGVHWDPPVPGDDLTPYLLVHGLASNARLWDGVGRRLAQLGHQVVAIDQRGHGQSSKPDVGYDMGTVADDLALLTDALGWERPAVAGQSWGGNVVLEFGYRHPERTHVVTCVDGGFIDLRAQFPDFDTVTQRLAPPPLAGTPLDTMRDWVQQSAGDWPEEGRAGTLANFEVRDDGTIAPWLTFERHMKVLEGMWEHPPTERYPVMQVPVLFIVADSGAVEWTHRKEDAMEVADQLVPKVRTEWFRPAHHDVHAQHPAEVAALLHDAATDPSFFDSPDPRQESHR